jgi:hypothetical protein
MALSSDRKTIAKHCLTMPPTEDVAKSNSAAAKSNTAGREAVPQ